MELHIAYGKLVSVTNWKTRKDYVEFHEVEGADTTHLTPKIQKRIEDAVKARRNTANESKREAAR